MARTAASSKLKLEVARAAGAHELICYGKGSLKEQVNVLTEGRGADVFFDPVGGDLFDQAIRAITWNGRLLVIGFASGRIPQLPVNLTLLKGAAVLGVFWGGFHPAPAARKPGQLPEAVCLARRRQVASIDFTTLCIGSHRRCARSASPS
jgi:NADPH:quinone reductase-like Zn-dependent oxidoreductase